MQGLNIKAGFASVDITPPLGVYMAGYFEKRKATGILDPLSASALALSDGEKKTVIISCDLLGINNGYVAQMKKEMFQKLGLTSENIIIHCTHTHLGPLTWIGPVNKEEASENGWHDTGTPDEKYMEELKQKLLDVTETALERMKDAIVHIGYGKEDGISFIRRYKLKDGSIKTNPNVDDPKAEIIKPMGTIDPSVGVISFRYTDGSGEILLVNFALHADIIGGSSFSADYPGHMRKEIKEKIPNCDVICIVGATGDINHVDFMHPENTGNGYDYSIKVGLILAGEVLKTHQNLIPVAVKSNDKTGIYSGQHTISVPKRKASAQDLNQAKALAKAFFEGTWNPKNMEEVAELASAYRSIELSKMGDQISFEIQAIAIGELAFVALPGEIFVDIGRKIKNEAFYKNTFICSNSNGYMGYFPTKVAFSEGGYETKNTMFTGEMEDLLVKSTLEVLEGLK